MTWDARVQNVRRQLRGLEDGQPVTGELVAPARPVSLEQLQRWNLWLSMGASAVVIVAGLHTLLKGR